MDNRRNDDTPRSDRVRLAGRGGAGGNSVPRDLPLGVNERRRGIGAAGGAPASGRVPASGSSPDSDIRTALRASSSRVASPAGTSRSGARRSESRHASARPAAGLRATDRTAAPRRSSAAPTARPHARRASAAPSVPRSQRGAVAGARTNRGRATAGRTAQAHPAQSIARGRRRNARRSRTGISPLFILIAVLVAVGGFGVYSAVDSMQRQAAEEAARIEAAEEKKRLEAMRVHPGKLGQQAVTVSTPRAQWNKGEMPHLYQTDPAWASLPYAGGDVRANACGPTCMSMVYVHLTGKKDLDPGAMSAFADAGNYAPTGATEWRFMTEGAQSLGLGSSPIPVTRATITQALDSGQPVICSVEPGDFTTVGHYIVLKSIDERGMVEVFDPNSPLNSAKRWGIQRILRQAAMCWTFWA